MDKIKSLYFDDLDLKVPIGNITFNILNLSYEAPVLGWYYKNHSHSSYELHFIPYGKGKLKAHGQEFNIDSGTFYITGPNVFHEQKADSSEPMCEYCINFEIKTSRRIRKKNDLYITDEVESIFMAIKNTRFWFGKDEYNNFEIFEKIFEEFERNHIGCYTYIQSLILQIILNTARSFSPDKESGYFIPHKILNDSRRFQVDHYFSNYDKNLSPHELSKQIGVSERQLNRIMQEYYSMTFKEKLIDTRLSESKAMLLETNLPIKDIAEKTGFTTLSYFSRTFSRYYSISPSQLREAQR